jgi:hypothetical protein
MREDDDIDVIPYKKVLRKKSEIRINSFSLPGSKKVKNIPQIKNWHDPEGGFPMNKWIMPLQLQRYLKYSDHDLL